MVVAGWGAGGELLLWSIEAEVSSMLCGEWWWCYCVVLCCVRCKLRVTLCAVSHYKVKEVALWHEVFKCVYFRCD